ncbi:pseudouridine synthase [Tenacibaculum finnmarkense]|uniref:pseudouridine synthase n=1 Tax=Tenacibaculum finnmarkense TaxID=2781243 RepID=UPI00187BB73C|nr:pseudouridine synthase [Tenacibaculum finnmarkense]MBE7660369.1 pseudouridine synthase [Tenacibaculum finnmarkense genomovar finnmarkense]MCG8252023.1 pseudouridine synthase [Tenacibaculum finnmarkense genomovar finnmarkense]MCG8815552.1 pseudouridine synthase [Tenacibaculum finnmarkense]MCG8820610.1 pseudouridine synthase [Tenacibaculum finnmarkense]
MSLTVLFEDDYIICVSKPNNVVVHHAYHSRNVSEEESLLQLLFNQFGAKFYPIHRLDRKTSGIILLAKETKHVSKFQELFTNNEIQKTYYGIVRGHSPEQKVIDSPVKGRDSDVYKEAETHLKTVATVVVDIPVKPYDSSRYSLIEMKPTTGRLHQLRIHTNKISHPLIGDPKYGDKNHNTMFIDNFNCENLFLHAYSLEFTHPFSREKLVIKAALPNDWNTVFKRFEWTLSS